MRTLVLVILGIGLLVLGTDLSRTLFNDEQPHEAFQTLMDLPPRAIANPKTNGYLLLLGFAVDPSLDPVQTGHDMWLEVESDRGHRYFDYNKEKRLELRVTDDDQGMSQPLQAWADLDPIAQFQKQENSPRTPSPQYRLLVDRYSHWLKMPFEDWGYGHPGTPRFAELFAAHRLYVAEGFSQGMGKGIDRLHHDLSAWRAVLANAKTLSTKVMAACIVDDDARLMSVLLGQHVLEKVVFEHLSGLARPLDQAEQSMRWPIQNKFAIGVSRFERPFVQKDVVGQAESDQNKKWLAAAAGLNADAFHMVEHRLPANPIAKSLLQKQKLLNTYAQYYDALIKAAEKPTSPLPKLYDFAQTSSRTLVEYFVHPIENVFTDVSEPIWEPFIVRIQETNARLRLAALQAKLRRPPLNQEIPTRLAEAGPSLYDPFTGIPMLWSPTQGKLYSVGKDRLDDGGDSTLDISVSIFSPPTKTPPAPSQRGTKAKKQVRQR